MTLYHFGVKSDPLVDISKVLLPFLFDSQSNINFSCFVTIFT